MVVEIVIFVFSLFFTYNSNGPLCEKDGQRYVTGAVCFTGRVHNSPEKKFRKIFFYIISVPVAVSYYEKTLLRFREKIRYRIGWLKASTIHQLLFFPSYFI